MDEFGRYISMLVAGLTYAVVAVLAVLGGWAIALTWPVVWRAVVAGMVGALVYRLVRLGPKLVILRVLVSIGPALVLLWRLRGKHPDSQGEWVMLAALAAVPTWFLLVRRLPSFFTPPAANSPDAAAEERSPREFTSDDASRLVDLLDTKWGSTRTLVGGPGPRSGLRAVHTHGSWVQGTFRPTPSYGSANEWFSERDIPFLHAGVLEATVRFSNFSGASRRDDRKRQPHGMAIRLTSSSLGSCDFVALDMKQFMVRTRDDFISFMRYFNRSPLLRLVGWVRMAIVGRTTVQALAGMSQGSKVSYADRVYHGQNTFLCLVRDGDDRVCEIPVRLRCVPQHRPGNKIPVDSPLRLHDELQDRFVDHRTLVFRLELVDGRGVDPTKVNDPVRPWPANQSSFPLGVLEITECVPGDDHDGMVFNPHRLPRGMRPSDDEILFARRATYAASHVRRTEG